MGLLYQDIMNVPGLTGTWKERNKQLYELLGSPQGSYKGNYTQNIGLLKAIKDNDYYRSGLPGQTQSQPQVAAQENVYKQYTDPLTANAEKIANTPSFAEALPFYDAWGRMLPQATLAAESQVNPEAQRQFKSSYGDYMSNLTNMGGQRFGRGLQGGGELKAEAERNRLGGMQDWLNQYQQGYKDLFYNPSQTAWNQSITAGTAPDQDLKTIPTWNELYDSTNNMSGTEVGTSPFYG